jgi:hypothetical protein
MQNAVVPILLDESKKNEVSVSFFVSMTSFPTKDYCGGFNQATRGSVGWSVHK